MGFSRSPTDLKRRLRQAAARGLRRRARFATRKSLRPRMPAESRWSFPRTVTFFTDENVKVFIRFLVIAVIVGIASWTGSQEWTAFELDSLVAQGGDEALKLGDLHVLLAMLATAAPFVAVVM